MKDLQPAARRYRFLARGPLGPAFVFGWRAFGVVRGIAQEARLRSKWLFESRETTNLTYELTERSVGYICDAIAVALDHNRDEIRGYVDEVLNDKDLAAHVISKTKNSPFRHNADPAFRIGRRLGWYAIVRSVKPRSVIETGVDKGLGSVVICAALLRNIAEGYDGRYFGTEIKPEGGYLLSDKYAGVGTILYGDSVQSLRAFNSQIDVFVNDSDHSQEYEAAEYQAIKSKLGPRAVIIGDNADCTDKLCRFAHELGWPFLFIHEEPLDHWYQGAGIGLCVSPKLREARPVPLG